MIHARFLWNKHWRAEACVYRDYGPFFVRVPLYGASRLHNLTHCIMEALDGFAAR